MGQVSKRARGASEGAFFGWMDFDPAEAKLARDLIAVGGDPESQDAIGLGLVRDRIADSLFPGISTVQTRAKYFLIVPWACRIVEAEYSRHRDVVERLHRVERDVINALCSPSPDGAAPDKRGVMGRRSGRDLKRMPSEVYWTGLGTFGIRRRIGERSISLGEYPAAVAAVAAHAAAPRDVEDGQVTTIWDHELPPAPAGFPRICAIGLTANEAAYLSGQMQFGSPDDARGAVIRSMLAPLLRDAQCIRSAKFRKAAFPWDVEVAGMDADLRTRIEHARCFSELMWGAQLLYNDLLETASRTFEGVSARTEARLDRNRKSLSDAFAGWGQIIGQRRSVLERWVGDDDTWEFLFDAASFRRDSDFIRDWCARALVQGAALRTDPEARRRMIERERRVKPGNPRLGADGSVAKPIEERYGFRRLTYRWPNVQTVINDVVAGLDGAHARS